MNEATRHFRRVQEIFDEVIQLPSALRSSRLEGLCRGDVLLLSEVGSLLTAYGEESAATDSLRTEPHAAIDSGWNGRIGPYQIERLLGRGGMGAVYLAHRADGEYVKKVAIKLIDLPLATNLFRERFRHERQILAGLEHPLIARMLDGGVTPDGNPYLVMEYVEGEPIHTFCARRTLTLEARLQLFIGVCEAVQFAHQNLVVHRDLKPDNILVDGEGKPHLLDFGTAKLLSAPAAERTAFTREGFLSFTPQYASPEQVLGKPITTASDTYSLGVLLYLLLSARLPYELKEFSTEEMVRVICEEPPRRLSAAPELKPRLGADLESIVGKALRKEPDRRYGTAEQIQLDLEAYLHDRPVSARQGTVRYKAAKLVRRNTLAVTIGGLLLASMIAGSVGVLWQARVANRQRRIAEARSRDLRELSNSLLSELDEAIKQIPGSTSAQQLLVTRALEHLDRMARDAQGDKVAELDLAEAYTRLGKLQGDGYEQNLGDTRGAIASLDKAVTIASSLAASYPRDASVLSALAQAEDARGEVLSLANNNEAAATSLRSALKAYETLLALPGVTPQLLFDAGDVYDIYGDLLGQDIGFSDASGAIENYRKAIDLDQRALALDPGFMRVKRGLVTMQMKIGNVLLETDPAAAFARFTGALEAYGALPGPEQQRLNMQRLHAVLLRKQAKALSALMRYQEAEETFARSRAIYQQLYDADPKDFRALEDLKRQVEGEAENAGDASEPASGLPFKARQRYLHRAGQLYLEEEAVLRRLTKAGAKEDPYKAALDYVHVRLGTIRDQSGTSSSEEETRSATAALKADAGEKDVSAMTLDLVVSALLRVEPKGLRDPAYTLMLAKRGDEMTHHKSPGWFLSLAEAYRQTGQQAQAQAAAARGLSLLPVETEGNRISRTRRLLDALSSQPGSATPASR